MGLTVKLASRSLTKTSLFFDKWSLKDLLDANVIEEAEKMFVFDIAKDLFNEKHKDQSAASQAKWEEYIILVLAEGGGKRGVFFLFLIQGDLFISLVQVQ